jgi:hypothetical protein
MSLFPCSFCGQRAVGKLSSATWAWWTLDNARVAYRQRLCVQCYMTNIIVLEQSARDEPLVCPNCHTDPGESMDPCYLTVFVPGVGPLRVEMATCGACALQVRERATMGAYKLDDRQPSSGGLDSGPQTDPQLAAWKALGIEPRA